MKHQKLFLAGLLASVTLLSLVPNESAEQIAVSTQTDVVLYDGGTTLPEDEVSTFDEDSLMASVLGSKSKTKKTSEKIDTKTEEKSTKVEVKEDCSYEAASENLTPEYKAQLISIRKKFRYNLGEEFKVKVYVKNAGNTPWFSTKSTCIGAKVSLGTTRDNDRMSHFYAPDIKKDDNGWISANRVALDSNQLRVNPGEIASFTFWARADKDASVYREYFTPVITGVKWLNEAEAKIDVYSGTTSETAFELQKKLIYAYKSMRVGDMQIDGTRTVEVDLSEQKMTLKIDDYILREFTISSGAKATPTPTGSFPIMLKNEVRIGAKYPHYVMPRFQLLTPQGAGLHALPSLSNDNGTFWTEAKSHLGIPVSHGCVRMGPEDADFTFAFTEVGDVVTIHY